MIGQFKKAYLHRPIKILHFLTTARIQKCLIQLQNILAFLTINHLQTESWIQQGIFLHVILVRIIVPWYQANFLTCIGYTIKDQFGLLLSLNKWKYPSWSTKENNYLMSIYHKDFVPSCEIVRFESKPWVTQQNREAWQVCDGTSKL